MKEKIIVLNSNVSKMKELKMQNDYVKKVSFEEDNEKIDKDILKNLIYYKQNPDEIPNRIEEIEREQDIEKALESNASIIGLTGIVFSIIFGKKWLLVPAVVSGFLLQHALQGWSPPLSVLRKMGFRTRKEIETEKQALKLLHGDYDDISSGEDYNPEATIEKIKGTRITTDKPLTTSGYRTRTQKKDITM